MASLLMLGLLFVYSSSAVYSSQVYQDQMFLFRRQSYAVFLGVLIWMMLSRLSWVFLKKQFFWTSCVLVCCLILTLIPNPLQHKVGGASRWLHVSGMSFQPGECLKVSCLFLFAEFFGDSKKRYHLVLAFLSLVLFLFQPDFGSFVLLASIGLAGVFVRKDWFHSFLFLLVMVFSSFVFLVLLFPYRLSRFKSFLNPFADPLGKGFQVLQSLIACARGGLIGDGIGNSYQKLFFLPEAHNDFILSVIFEETGLIGSMLIWSVFCLLFYVLFLMLFRLSTESFWFVFFPFVFLFLEVFLHFSVVIGALPTKGLSLPFVSCGGTAIVSHCALLGLLSSLLRFEAKHQCEKDL
jgi:cell division protein FtsW